MAAKTLKDRQTELSARIRDMAKQQDPVAQAAIELVGVLLEAAKESLVTTDGNDMLRKQGAARQLKNLYDELTTTPPTIPKT